MENLSFEKLLKDAVELPGRISEAYQLFHDYSSGNQFLALTQCYMRGLKPGPISTFKGWQKVGRHVRKGEKALMLCMPVGGKRSEKMEDGTERESGFVRFIFRNNWFVLSQTEGADFLPLPAPKFNMPQALAALEIEQVDFDMLNGNCQGYAIQRKIAVSPLADHPLRTSFHEIAHVLLGHTSDSILTDSEHTPRSLREVEAEAVSMICGASLGLEGVEYSRGYIQHWLRGETIPEKSARRIFTTANQILTAGRMDRPAAMPLFDGQSISLWCGSCGKTVAAKKGCEAIVCEEYHCSHCGNTLQEEAANV